MTKPIPKINKYMTSLPQTIGVEQNIEVAESMMQRLKIRHLPVLSGGKLVGIFTAVDALSAFAELLQSRLKG